MTENPSPRPADLLGRDIPLSHVGYVRVLGWRVRFETNHPGVLTAAEDSFGPLSDGGDPAAPDSPVAARVRVYVQDGDEGPSPRPQYRSPEPNRLVVATRASFGIAEIDRKTAYAYVSESLLADVRHFQYGMLETLALTLVAGCNRQPVHAAAVAEGGVALLLLGRSGSGKSSLAYSAARTGLGVLSEDTVYVQSEPGLRLWTVPRRLHLLPDAVRFFPELNGQPPARLPTGKTKLVIETDRERTRRMLPVAHVGVCLLEKGIAAPQIQKAEASEVERALSERLEPGFDFFRGGAVVAGRALAAGALRCWRLRTSSDPRESVPLLRQMLAELAGAAASRSLPVRVAA